MFLSHLEALHTFEILRKVVKKSAEATIKENQEIMVETKLTLPKRFLPLSSSRWAATPLKMLIATQSKKNNPAITRYMILFLRFVASGGN